MNKELQNYCEQIKEYIYSNYRSMFREPAGLLKHPFIVPGSAAYAHCLWDWDSYWVDIALHQIACDHGDEDEKKFILEYGKGCILNFLDNSCAGWMPIAVTAKSVMPPVPESPARQNCHKPVLAQHAAFLVRQMGGDAGWLRESFAKMQHFHNLYRGHFRHRATGLYFWVNDYAIGVDNDPCTMDRPDYSSASILLNSFIYREFMSAAYIADCLNLDAVAADYRKNAAEVRAAVREHCFDNWTGFFYSCDLNLNPRKEHTEKMPLHFGLQREWDCLIMRIGVWSGFMALWSGIASKEEAARVAKFWNDPDTFAAEYGIRTLSKQEKMYSLNASSNPSNWLGPIWGLPNYAVYRSMKLYGYEDDARNLAEKTVRLFGRDLQQHGAFNEYYQPDNGEPISHVGFQSWNYLVLNMIADLEGRPVITE